LQRNLKPPRWSLRTIGAGLPITAWLVLGFAFVIGAFVTSNIVTQRSARLATADVARAQDEFEPLARHARELGAAAAAFDRAVLAFLRSGSAENKSAVVEMGTRLSEAITESSEFARLRNDPRIEEMAARLAHQQAEGFQLVQLQENRNATLRNLEKSLADLDRRMASAGGRGLRFGDNLLARPAIVELTEAVERVRNDAVSSLAQRSGDDPPATTRGEIELRNVLDRYATELSQSPGEAWLGLLKEDFNRAMVLRRRMNQLESEMERARIDYSATGDALTTQIREEIEAPAWRELTASAENAKRAVDEAKQTIADATFKSVLLALLVLAITAAVVTWPVRRLTAGARRLASGDLTTRVRAGGASEVAELAYAFNQMAAELDAAERAVKSYQAQLEARVEERTQQLRHLADHDPLTSLPNRRHLFQRLNELIHTTTGVHGHLAVLFLDLDNFKTVNDSLGHEFGDRVLSAIGERLREATGEAGFIARLGGDEFTVVFHFSGDVAEIERRAGALVSLFQQPLLIDRREISIGVSCGAAVHPDHGRDAASLLRAADAALFRAKELGRNRVCVYDPELLIAASNRFRVEQALRKAIDGGDFVLHFQPQVCLTKLQTTAVEGLLRWRQNGLQIVHAHEFIAIAEQSGLMLDLNDWVLERGADAVRQWRAAGWKDARVALNVSAQQFVAGDFLGAVERLLRRHDLPPECLELELTENMLQTGAITVETLHGLQLLGVATALDDFGTGYSSLTSLEQLPLSRVKLDRSVVAEVDWNPRAASIARSIIALCRGLGLQVTVEGVERPSQLDFLVGCGDVSVQGYLIAHPADGADVIDFVNRTKPRMQTLLDAAQMSRAERLNDTGGGAVPMLRRRTRPTGGRSAE
jgi:diguanylate cyclase (GGDEF)-like protein